jgi:dipeptidyl-peptidase 4
LKLIVAAVTLSASFAVFAPAQAQQAAKTPATAHPWTIADIGRASFLSAFPPSDPVWSPNSRYLTYLSPKNDDLLSVDPATGKISVLVEHAKLQSIMESKINEKDRDHRNRYHTSDYHFAPNSTDVLFDTGGELWLYNTTANTGAKVTDTGSGSGDDPKFSPDSAYISYLSNHNLFVHNLHGSGADLNLTNTTDPAVLNGEVDWVYEEELDVRSNYFWSPDSKSLAYLQANEAKVPEYPLVDWIPTHPTTDQQRYPQPGDPNPDVRVGVVSITGGATQWIKLPLSPGDDYIPRLGWVNDHIVWVETLTRDHKHFGIWFADARTGEARQVISETAEKFFDESYDVTFLTQSPQVIVTSWRDGFTHMYLYTYDAAAPLASDARLNGEVEKGDYEVDEVEGVNESAKTIFYRSNQGDPLQKQIWAVRYDGTGKHQVSVSHGYHKGTVAPNGAFFADEASDTIVPPTMSVCNAAGTCNSYWHGEPIKDFTVRAPQELHLKAADGKTVIYAALLLPEGVTSAASVPLLNNPYGGPHAQTVDDRFSPELFFDQLCTEHGIAVLHVDNRGMGGRGRDFAYAAYHDMGPVQFADQMAAIDQVLAQNPVLDPKRLGWWGWSWGGTFTLWALTHSDRFKAGVAVAPVTDWHNYDSIYTERYMSLPTNNAAGYKDNSAITTVASLKGRILIAHGTGDDNVHMQNTIQYIQGLVNAGVPYDLQLFPRKTHSIAGPEARLELFNRIVYQFETYLRDAK